MLHRYLICLSVTLLSSGGRAADEGQLRFADDFGNRSELGKDYYTAPAGEGAWAIRDGVLVGKQINEDHGAVMRKDLEFDDVAIEIDFRFNGGSRFNFVIDDKKEKSVHAGHICRVSISPKRLSIGDDKTGTMNLEVRKKRKAKNLPPEERKSLDQLLARTQASAPINVKPGDWHTLRVRIEGDLMIASIDGKEVTRLKSSGIDHPTKTKFGMTVVGSTIDFDNLKVFDLKESPNNATSNSTPNIAVGAKSGATFYLDFPELGKTWRGGPARAGVYLPTDYSADKKMPLFVWFGGGAGSDNPKRAVEITEGEGFICVALPYRNEEDGKSGGWQTPWSYYKTILDAVAVSVPNIDPEKRVCGGFSSGGAAIMHQIGNSDGAFQKYFHAFMPGGAGWPMGGLESIKDRPMLAFMGEKDKRLPNFKKLEEQARAAGVDFKLLIFNDVGHKMPAEQFPKLHAWLKNSVTQPSSAASE